MVLIIRSNQNVNDNGMALEALDIYKCTMVYGNIGAFEAWRI
jgi:hypothetical protein